MFANRSSARRNREVPDARRRVILTDRDRQLLVDLFLQRAMTRRQLQDLRYFSSTSVANDRLRKLFDAGYLRRSFLSTGAYATEAVYYVGKSAVPEIVLNLGLDLREVTRLTSPGSSTHLAHAIAATDARITFLRGAPAGIGAKWLTEPECRHEFTLESSANSRIHVLKPDGALVVNGREAGFFFVEIDRGHVSRDQFEHACVTYRKYLDGGLAEQTHGRYKFQVICITTGGSLRIRHLGNAANRAGIALRLATRADFAADPYGDIWQSADLRHSSLLVGVNP